MIPLTYEPFFLISPIFWRYLRVDLFKKDFYSKNVVTLEVKTNDAIKDLVGIAIECIF